MTRPPCSDFCYARPRRPSSKSSGIGSMRDELTTRPYSEEHIRDKHIRDKHIRDTIHQFPPCFESVCSFRSRYDEFFIEEQTLEMRSDMMEVYDEGYWRISTQEIYQSPGMYIQRN